MRLKIATVVFVLLVFCSHAVMANDVNKLFNQFDVKTVGNHSYIRIGVHKNPDEYSSQILVILEEFEKSNPDKDVVAWKVEKQQKTYSCFTTDYIFGLWIDHKSKVK